MDYSGLRVGPQTAADGTLTQARGTRDGAAVSSNIHGYYQEAVFRGNVFVGANQAAATLTSIGTTAQTGLILVNPPGSGKNLVILQVDFALTGVGNAATLACLCVQATASATLASPATNMGRNALIGGGNQMVGILTNSASLSSNPVVVKTLQACGTTTLPAAVNPPVVYTVDGSIILPPGTAATVSSIVTTVTGLSSITWEEIPA